MFFIKQQKAQGYEGRLFNFFLSFLTFSCWKKVSTIFHRLYCVCYCFSCHFPPFLFQRTRCLWKFKWKIDESTERIVQMRRGGVLVRGIESIKRKEMKLEMYQIREKYDNAKKLRKIWMKYDDENERGNYKRSFFNFSRKTRDGELLLLWRRFWQP